MKLRSVLLLALAYGAGALLSACSGSANGGATGGGTLPATATQSTAQTQAQSTAAQSISVLAKLDDEQTVGSVMDPATGDVNPYGLDVAKVSSGKISAGDLVVCDFNDSANVQGTGDAIVALHPQIGSTPRSIAHAGSLLGCNALAMAPNGTIWLAAFGANDNPIFSSSGTLFSTLSNGPWHHPFGQAFVPPVNSISVPAFYVSNAGDGSIVRVYVYPGPSFRFSVIATGFPVNHGVPGSILSPSGLNYDNTSGKDRLYIVDGTNNTLYAIDRVSGFTANSLTVNGLTFGGKYAFDAHVIYHGAPLNGPISSAILPGGNIVLGNTLDPNGKNLMVEISPAGKLLDVKNVDTGAAGAIFGMVATGTTLSNTRLYFNDDNDNTVKVLTP
jgi:hypothetical protein